MIKDFIVHENREAPLASSVKSSGRLMEGELFKWVNVGFWAWKALENARGWELSAWERKE